MRSSFLGENPTAGDKPPTRRAERRDDRRWHSPATREDRSRTHSPTGEPWSHQRQHRSHDNRELAEAIALFLSRRGTRKEDIKRLLKKKNVTFGTKTTIYFYKNLPTGWPNQQATKPALGHSSPPAKRQSIHLPNGSLSNPTCQKTAYPPVKWQPTPPAKRQPIPPAKRQSIPPAKKQSILYARRQSIPPARRQPNPPAKRQSTTPAKRQSTTPAKKQSTHLPEGSLPHLSKDSPPHIVSGDLQPQNTWEPRTQMLGTRTKGNLLQ